MIPEGNPVGIDTQIEDFLPSQRRNPDGSVMRPDDRTLRMCNHQRYPAASMQMLRNLQELSEAARKLTSS